MRAGISPGQFERKSMCSFYAAAWCGIAVRRTYAKFAEGEMQRSLSSGRPSASSSLYPSLRRSCGVHRLLLGSVGFRNAHHEGAECGHDADALCDRDGAAGVEAVEYLRTFECQFVGPESGENACG